MRIIPHKTGRLIHYIRIKNTTVILRATITISIQIDIPVHLKIIILLITSNTTATTSILMDIMIYLKIDQGTVDMKEVKLVATTVVNSITYKRDVDLITN